MLAVVFSSDTVDGVCAAACILRGLRLKGLPCRFGGTISADERERDLQHLAEQANCGLFIADIPLTSVPDLFIEPLSKRCSIMYWSFTQAVPNELLAQYSPFIKHVDYAERKTTATELAAFRFLPGDLVAKQLISVAQDIKFWQRQDERAAKLADLLASGFDVRAMVDALSRGVIWDDLFERSRNEYLEKKAKAYEDVLKRLTIKSYLKYKFGFALAPSLLSTADACQYVLDKHMGVDISVALYKSGKIAFRSREGIDLDLARIGKLFGGGGQKYASGGLFNQAISAEHWDEVIASLDWKLKEYFLS
ncbi:hypothetical protein HY492_02100 [Candidatus Woesearchaeota archaeon]|nr:hypothetical protein [Candidatus Woesearchaeota archaeon]